MTARRPRQRPDEETSAENFIRIILARPAEFNGMGNFSQSDYYGANSFMKLVYSLKFFPDSKQTSFQSINRVRATNVVGHENYTPLHQFVTL